jgi:hypothetical protein
MALAKNRQRTRGSSTVRSATQRAPMNIFLPVQQERKPGKHLPPLHSHEQKRTYATSSPLRRIRRAHRRCGLIAVAFVCFLGVFTLAIPQPQLSTGTIDTCALPVDDNWIEQTDHTLTENAVPWPGQSARAACVGERVAAPSVKPVAATPRVISPPVFLFRCLFHRKIAPRVSDPPLGPV